MTIGELKEILEIFSNDMDSEVKVFTEKGFIKVSKIEYANDISTLIIHLEETSGFAEKDEPPSKSCYTIQRNPYDGTVGANLKCMFCGDWFWLPDIDALMAALICNVSPRFNCGKCQDSRVPSAAVPGMLTNPAENSKEKEVDAKKSTERSSE